MLLMPLEVSGWGLVNFRYFYISWSMVVMALLVISRWDSLYPDRADYQILTPLPVRPRTYFFARAIAFAVLIGVFLVVANDLGILMWPGVELKMAPGRAIATHAFVTGCAGLFSALAAATIPAVLINILSAAWFRRVLPVAQSVLTGMLILLLFVTPLLGVLVKSAAEVHTEWLFRYPGYWFLGLYEQSGPVSRNVALAEAGSLALPGLGGAFVTFLLTWVPGYVRHSRKLLDAPASSNSRPGKFRSYCVDWLHANVLTTSVERAVFHYMGATLARSTRHRLFLAAYGGFGAALTVASLASGRESVAGIQFTLAFVLVSALRAVFQIPAELKANWAFQLTEGANMAEYLAATRKWIVVCALGPLFAGLAVSEFYFFNPGIATYHLVFGGTTALVLVEVAFAGFRKVPFTCPYLPGKVNLVGLVVLYLFGLSFYSKGMRLIQGLVDQSPVGAAVCVALVLVTLAAFGHWRKRNIATYTSGVDFDGSDPEVRTLGLVS